MRQKEFISEFKSFNDLDKFNTRRAYLEECNIDWKVFCDVCYMIQHKRSGYSKKKKKKKCTNVK